MKRMVKHNQLNPIEKSERSPQAIKNVSVAKSMDAAKFFQAKKAENNKSAVQVPTMEVK